MSSAALPSRATVSPALDSAGDTGQITGVREVPAWAVSLVVHLLVILAFWRMTVYVGDKDPEIDIASEMTEVEPDALAFATAEDQIGSQSDANTSAPSRMVATYHGKQPEKKVEEEAVKINADIKIREQQPITEPLMTELTDHFEAKGAHTAETGGTEGAIDRLTWEIENSLKERKTLVIWVFDASQSLTERRKLIAERFENVYKQLGERNADYRKSLKTAVVAYGNQTTFVTEKPVDDVASVIQAVNKINPDTSGKEYVFTAIRDIMTKWRSTLASYRAATTQRRNVMLVVVTDERGDDYAGKSGKDPFLLENLIRDMRRFGIRGYTVGNAAVFGREKGFVSFKDKTGYVWNDLPVDQGPETVMPERLQLPFWGGSNAGMDRLSASYGPYALTRMCAETGGLYLITEHSRSKHKFDPLVMKAYAPDYRPIARYVKDMQANRAKKTLNLLANQTLKKRLPRPQLGFQANNDTVLRQQITEAQKPLAVLDHDLEQMLAVLEAAEKDRDKIKEPRWQAGFDLAMGRLLAMRVRAFGYNMVLAEMKSQPLSFKKSGSNQWRLRASHAYDKYPPPVKKLAKKAEMYLTRVIDKHDGTPWSVIAQKELSIPMGWEWQEDTMTVARNGRGAGNNDPGVQLANENDPNNPNRMKKKQPTRKPPQL